MKQPEQESLNEWIFPSVESWYEQEVLNKENSLSASEPEQEPEIDILEQERQQQAQALLEEKQQLEASIAEYKNKVQLLNNLIVKVNQSMDLIDDEMIMLNQAIIQKMVKNLIFKEIELDSNLIPGLLDILKKQIVDQGGILNISLSKQDYEALPEDELKNNHIEIDHSLNRGDIHIQSRFSEIHAILDERINLLMQINHE